MCPQHHLLAPHGGNQGGSNSRDAPGCSTRPHVEVKQRQTGSVLLVNTLLLKTITKSDRLQHLYTTQRLRAATNLCFTASSPKGCGLRGCSAPGASRYGAAMTTRGSNSQPHQLCPSPSRRTGKDPQPSLRALIALQRCCAAPSRARPQCDGGKLLQEGAAATRSENKRDKPQKGKAGEKASLPGEALNCVSLGLGGQRCSLQGWEKAGRKTPTEAAGGNPTAAMLPGQGGVVPCEHRGAAGAARLQWGEKRLGPPQCQPADGMQSEQPGESTAVHNTAFVPGRLTQQQGRLLLF